MTLSDWSKADLEQFIRNHLQRPEVRKSILSGVEHWLTGSGAPASNLGGNGDFYLDTATKTVYVKQSGAWV